MPRFIEQVEENDVIKLREGAENGLRQPWNRKAVSIQIGLCLDPHLWDWIFGSDWNNSILQTAEMEFVWRVHAVTLRDEVRRCEIGKSWMSKHSSFDRKDLSCNGLATCPWCSRKDRWGTLCWLRHRESVPEVAQWPRGDYIFDLAWSRLRVQNYYRLLKTVRYSEPSWGCCPRDPLERKSGCAV